jgi:hypothetical protein
VRVQKSYSPYAISHEPWFSCSINLLHIYRHLTSPDLDYLSAIAHWSTCSLKTDSLNNTTLDTTHSSGHALHTDASEKMFGSHSQIIYIIREHKHCPRTQFLTNKRLWLSLQFLLSLSLSSMSSCSNELDHSRRSGRSRSWPKLFATELLTLLFPFVFLKISPRLQLSLRSASAPQLTSSQHCLPSKNR